MAACVLLVTKAFLGQGQGKAGRTQWEGGMEWGVQAAQLGCGLSPVLTPH